MNLNQTRFKQRLIEIKLERLKSTIKTVCANVSKSLGYNRANFYSEILPAATWAAYKALLDYDPARGLPLKTYVGHKARYAAFDYLRCLRHGPRNAPVTVQSLSQEAADEELYSHEPTDYREEPVGGGRVGHKIDPMELIPAESRPLMKAIYYDDLTQAELAESMGVGQSIVSYLHTQALDHARYMAEGLK